MKLLARAPELQVYDCVEDFITACPLGKNDLLLTNRYIFTPGKTEAQVLYQEDYGKGEPSDEMFMAIHRQARHGYQHVVCVGGGTVLDLAKLLSLNIKGDPYPYFTGEKPVAKRARLTLVPTTCGTGSEVTNIAVMAFERVGVKQGLANDALFADEAALVPAFLAGLPYAGFAFSSLDALIHVIESWLSPKATDATRLFAQSACERILRCYRAIQKDGYEARLPYLRDMLLASTFAGLSFGTAGCATIHAMSYPFGSAYHVAHGEANYALLPATLRFYADRGCLDLPCGLTVSELLPMLEAVLPLKPLSAYGVRRDELPGFVGAVLKRQQRLLGNSPFTHDAQTIMAIYELAY